MVSRSPLPRSAVSANAHTYERNEWGFHDRVAFVPAGNELLRCPKCNRLMQNDFTDEGRCPSCGYTFDKGVARDMLVEAKAVKTNFGSWRSDVLQELEKHKVPTILARNQSAKPVGDVARTMVARNRAAGERLIQNMRKKSPVSKLKFQPRVMP